MFPRFLILLVFVVSLFGCESGGGTPQGLLGGKNATSSEGVRDSARLTDGQVPAEGSSWNSNRTTIFAGQSSRVDFDLGAPKSIEAIALMADNNDTYRVLGSEDGSHFSTLWTAPRVSQAGMRWRHKNELGKKARYLRLQPGKGDSSLSLAELVVFETPQAALPPPLKVVPAEDMALKARSALLVAGALLLFSVLFLTKGAALSMNITLACLALGAVGYCGVVLYEVAPLQNLEVSLVRGVAATVAAGVILRWTYSPAKWQPVRSFQVAVLAVLAVVSVGAFYNMGTPQFFDHKAKEPSVVHNYDMRVYFPVAKYFDELKYDGLYAGSVASYAEDHGGLKSPSIQRVELRDLRDHRMRKVSELEDEIVSVQNRFSPARWQEFKKDMSYFWETMGSRGYLGSMSDHGGNATPVWLSVAHLMYGKVMVSNEVLLWGALLDPLLLLLFAICAWRSFGAATACVCLIIYGANDFYMFGSNWAGATLRNDWMVCLGLGACALKSERFKLGGALLAMAALIRAFPAMALLALGVPVAHWLVETHRAEGKLPTWSRLFKEQRWFFDTAIGATICVVVSVLASSLYMGFDAWPLWIKKISSFTASPHVNHLSLITVVGGSEGRQAEVLQQRWLVQALGTALFFVLALWNGAKASPQRAALLGMMMMPVVMYPANYYIHFIFILPLLVSEVGLEQDRFTREAAGKTLLLLLGLCAAQYFTVREEDLAVHFYNASVLLIAALLGILIVLLPRDDEGRVDFDNLPWFGKS